MQSQERRRGPRPLLRDQIKAKLEEHGPLTLHDLSLLLERPVDSLGVTVFKLIADEELMTLGRVANPSLKGGRPLNVFGLPGQEAPETKLRWEEDQEAILTALRGSPKTLDELMTQVFPTRSKHSIRVRLGHMTQAGLILRDKTVREVPDVQVVTLYGLTQEELDRVKRTQPDIQRRVMDQLASRGPRTIVKLADELKVSGVTVRRCLKRLEGQGKVFQVDVERYGRGTPRIVYWIKPSWP